MSQRIQNPAARHIPEELNVARRAREMPWRVVGGRILLYMMKGEERQTDSGLVIPNVKGHLGEQKERTYGLVVAFGAGELGANGTYISPEHDYGMYIGAVVMIDPNSGTLIMDETEEYRSITVWDIVSALDPAYGKRTYQRLRTRATAALKKYESDKEDVGFHTPAVAAVGMNTPDLEEALEMARTEGGTATKKQYLVKGLKKE